MKIKKYFENIYLGIKTTVIGLLITLKYFFKRKTTLCYPEKREELPLSFRGAHKYNKNKCTACGVCKINCPVSCIEIEAEGKGKDVDIKSYRIDYEKCIFCSLCEEVCPHKAIYLSDVFDLCTDKREDTLVDFVKRDSIKEIKTKN
ncbi:MAG: 4Fe-4S binding protein [Bdellovibrionota bacterium]